MDLIPYALLTVAFAGLIHGGFALGTSLLTLLNGHSLSRSARTPARHARTVDAVIGTTPTRDW